MTEQGKVPGIALASLFLGILGPLGAIPAIVCGHIARARIKAAGGRIDGGGIALAGLVLGYGTIAVCALVVGWLIAAPSKVKEREADRGAECAAILTAIENAKNTLAVSKGLKFGDAVPESDLTPYLPVPVSQLKCPEDGVYTVNAIGKNAECSVHGTASRAAAAPR